jgi:hypothetical protein
MHPYINTADSLRSHALNREESSHKYDTRADLAERTGWPLTAAVQYRQAAMYLRSAAAFMRAAHVAGGTDRDLTHADMLELAANTRESWANNLESAR